MQKLTFLSLISVFLMQSFCAAQVIRMPTAHLVVAEDGSVLHSKNASMSMYPASLTKLMTLYVAFDALKSKQINFNTKMTISKYAAKRPKSNIRLRRNNTINVGTAILSLIVRSANDSSVVIAEHLAGSEEAFAVQMNQIARELGMFETNFTNASGLHDLEQKTTAYDMAKLAIAVKRDFPEYAYLFKKTSFAYRGIVYGGQNYVNAMLRGANGLKTGFTSKAGWNIITAAKRSNLSLIGVILGGNSRASRDNTMIRLLNTHFKNHLKQNKNSGFKNKLMFASKKTDSIKKLA